MPLTTIEIENQNGEDSEMEIGLRTSRLMRL